MPVEVQVGFDGPLCDVRCGQCDRVVGRGLVGVVGVEGVQDGNVGEPCIGDFLFVWEEEEVVEEEGSILAVAVAVVHSRLAGKDSSLGNHTHTS